MRFGGPAFVRFLFLGLAFVAVLGADVLAQGQQGARKPNVIAIVTDDQGQWTLGAYGNRDARTPNLDRLAAEGALFVNAFVNTPVCSPSRASFLTGLHGTQVGITDWINMNEADAGVGLPVGTATWPGVLQRNGYATALVGKWHLGHLPQFHPTKQGYGHFWGFLGGGTEPMDPQIEIDGKRQKLKGPVPDLMTDEAMRWVEANAGKPFALSLHFREPHLPYAPVPEEDAKVFRDAEVSIPAWERLDEKFTKDLTRRYYASIHAVDRNVGRLLAKLDELKLSENTIVLFTSDHGYNVGHHVIHGKGNGNWIGGGVPGPKRPNMFETSVKVPLIVRWPGGGIKAGTRVEQPVMNVDTFATVVALTGSTVLENVKQHGRDFSPLLRGESPSDWSTDVYGQYDLHNAGIAFLRMVRTPEWKLVVHHMTNGESELYNLKDDPEERRNLYYNKKTFPEREALRKKLIAWQESIGDPVLKLDAGRPIEMAPMTGQ